MAHVNQDGHTMLDVCGCGRLHLTYGAITLNVRREEFLRFAREVERLADYLTGLQRTARPFPQATTKCH